MTSKIKSEYSKKFAKAKNQSDLEMLELEYQDELDRIE